MGEKRGMKALEAWCRKVTSGYRDVKITDMSTSWRDGLAFCAVLHHFRPDLIDFDSLSKENIFYNNNLAFTVAEQQLGIAALLDAEDMVAYKVPDRLSILTYVSQLYQHFHAMEAPLRKGPTKRSLTEDKADTLAETPGKRSAANVTSVTQSTKPSPASAAPLLSRNHEVCHVCRNRVYILERLIVENKLYHRTCLKCAKCHIVLSLGSYVESDRPDQYECVQCPTKASATKMATNSQPVFSIPPATSAVASNQEANSATSESSTVRRSLFPSRPDAGVSLEIALAAAKARSQFHSKWLNDTSTSDEPPPPPVVDTGQAVELPPSKTSVCDTIRNFSGVNTVETLPEVPLVMDHQEVPSDKPPKLSTSGPPKKSVSDSSEMSSTSDSSELPKQHQAPAGKHLKAPVGELPKEHQTSAKELPKQHQTSAKELPKEHQASAKELPKEHQASAKELPKHHQASAKELPKEHQAYAKELPKGYQASARELPKEHKASARELPKEHQASARELPKEHQASARELPKEHQASARELPKEHQASARELPKEHQASARELPKEHQASARELPKEHQASTNELPKEHHVLANELSKPLQTPAEKAPKALNVPEDEPPKASTHLPNEEPPKALAASVMLSSSFDNQLVTQQVHDRPSLPAKPSHLQERPPTLALRHSFQPQPAVKPTDTESVAVSENLGRPPSHTSADAIQTQEILGLQEGKASVPVAAPRVSRAKRLSKMPQEINDQRSITAAEVCESAQGMAMPVPMRRTSLTMQTTEGSAPPKPPRRTVLPDFENGGSENRKPQVMMPNGATGHTSPKILEYPVDLNPFGEDDEDNIKVKSQVIPEVTVLKEQKSLNPFGDSDDEQPIDVKSTPLKQEVPQRRVIPCDWYNKSLNPFSSDSDEDDDDDPGDLGFTSQSQARRAQEISVAEQAEGKSALRKKRAAPKPPSSSSTGTKLPSDSGLATPSPKMTPSGSPMSSSKPRAPKPPSPHPTHSRRHSASPVSMRKTLSAQEAAQRVSNWSDMSSSSAFQTPDSEEGSRPSSIACGSSNTFGAWKKKKRRAPPLPIPQKRQLQKIPLKEIEVELQEMEEKQLDLEKQGVELEIAIREKFDDEADPSPEEEDLVLQLFELVNKKNALFRRQTELVYLKRQQRLEEEHADLEYQIRCLMSKPEHEKTEEDRAEEEQLISRLVNVVSLRSEIVESMEMDRLREAQEDRSIHERLTLHQRSSSLGSLSLLGNTLSPGSKGSSTSSMSSKGKAKKEKKKKNKNKPDNGENRPDVTETQSLSRTFNELDKKRRWF